MVWLLTHLIRTVKPDLSPEHKFNDKSKPIRSSGTKPAGLAELNCFKIRKKKLWKHADNWERCFLTVWDMSNWGNGKTIGVWECDENHGEKRERERSNMGPFLIEYIHIYDINKDNN